MSSLPIVDRPRARVLGFRQRQSGEGYERIVPQAGRLRSEVLGLDLTVEGALLRFYHGTAPLLFMDELVGRLNGMVTDLVEARDAALLRAEEEARRASALENEVAELRAALKRLKRER